MSNKNTNKRSDYRHFLIIPTRWMDNDVYGHVNNVIYYSYFDTVVNKFLIDEELLDYERGNVVGLVVETKCEYFFPISFPDLVTAGLKVSHVGRSSVRYEVGLFRNDDLVTAAQGYFVHVYVTRPDNKPTPLKKSMLRALEKIK